jgi:hypothetical protein
MHDTAELLAAFIRIPVPDQGRFEATARAILGDVPQVVLLRQAAKLWTGELPVVTVRMSHGAIHWMLVAPIRVHLPGSRGLGLRRDAGSLLCVTPSSRGRYPGIPRPAPEAEATCGECIRMAAAYSPADRA